MKIATKAAFPT